MLYTLDTLPIRTIYPYTRLHQTPSGIHTKHYPYAEISATIGFYGLTFLHPVCFRAASGGPFTQTEAVLGSAAIFFCFLRNPASASFRAHVIASREHERCDPYCFITPPFASCGGGPDGPCEKVKITAPIVFVRFFPSFRFPSFPLFSVFSVFPAFRLFRFFPFFPSFPSLPSFPLFRPSVSFPFPRFLFFSLSSGNGNPAKKNCQKRKKRARRQRNECG